MNISLLLHTLAHLKPIQIFYQSRYRLFRPSFHTVPYTGTAQKLSLPFLIPKGKCVQEQTFTFLNLSAPFISWNDTRQGMLWTYNLNYMDWLQQEDISWKEGEQWIDRFITDLPQNKIGLDPYPIALRGINWIKFITQHAESISKQKINSWNQSLYAQYQLLTQKLEYHLLGNHLLEDAYSLFFGALYFADISFYQKATKLLSSELNEQVLSDGAHYEQSPMYHCILLERLLDCYNLSIHNSIFKGQDSFTQLLKQKAQAMLGHLESILYEDKTYPLFNDSATGIAPLPRCLFRYASQLGIIWNRLPLEACGYRHFKNMVFEGFTDTGNLTATYQPGHSHADTFTYELRIKGNPFIIDTGISTYNKNQRRQLERSTKAHNTVVVSHQDSSEVWGGFRVGRRAHVTLHTDTSTCLEATHDGFGKKALHRRRFELNDNVFTITDNITSELPACSYIHFAPDVNVLSCDNQLLSTDKGIIRFDNAEAVEIRYGKTSTAYNCLRKTAIAVIHFKKHSTYHISLPE
ncbi:alginate lyase family protein [Bacteroides acidifaciens]|uniref:alginate lyase family protein n=1 Tax=Bacteroides acidifaciens TaxID=85831 RepID=UPI00258CB335|nr:alginate lyase family protein [Bacteroides acidifaciens]